MPCGGLFELPMKPEYTKLRLSIDATATSKVHFFKWENCTLLFQGMKDVIYSLTDYNSQDNSNLHSLTA